MAAAAIDDVVALQRDDQVALACAVQLVGLWRADDDVGKALVGAMPLI
jgi:hypothetical protein